MWKFNSDVFQSLVFKKIMCGFAEKSIKME
jgi:hypothetical protein